MNFLLSSTRILNRPTTGYVPHRRKLTAAASSSGGANAKPSLNSTPKPKSQKEEEEKGNGKPEAKTDTPAPTHSKPIEVATADKTPKVIASKAKAAPSGKIFKNRNKFVVPIELRSRFDDVWETRKKVMEGSIGFQGLQIDDGSFRKDGSREITVASEWASIPEWEAYSCSDGARRSHLPPGIFQVVPKKGEGFPEDFTPFVDFADAVNAKY